MIKFYTSVQKLGNKILYRGIKDGRRVQMKYSYSPKLFIPSSQNSKWKSLQGDNLELIQFKTIKEANDFVNQYAGVENFKIYGNTGYQYAFITDEFPNSFEWDIKHIDIAVIDIEVASKNGFPNPDIAQEEIIAITITRFGGSPQVFGCGSYTPAGDEVYHKCANEVDLCERFMSFWENDYPDIISGWFSKSFDIPYLVNRFKVLFGEDYCKRLSPWGNVYKKTSYQRLTGKEIVHYDILGVSHMDYLDLYKNFAKKGKTQENYRLDTIANSELGDGKVSYEKYDNLHQLYEQNFQKFIEYNIKDVDIILRLDDKLKLMELALTLAYETKSNFEDVFTQTRMWDANIYNYLFKKNIIVDPKNITTKDQAFEGAYVKDPQVGLHKWVASFDLNSLYPHLMMQYNISPDTIIEYSDYTPEMKNIISKVNLDNLLNKNIDLSKLKNCTVTPNCQFYRTDKKGFLPEMLESMYDDRKKFKNLQLQAEQELENCGEDEKEGLQKKVARYNNLQTAMKLCLNSAYGVMGTKYFRYYDIRNALSVTQTGKLSIRWIENNINNYFQKLLKDDKDRVIASDTDSIYVNLSDLVNKFFPNEIDENVIINFMDRICEDKLQPFIDQSYKELAEYVNAYAQKMKMKREVLANKGIWTAKKRYILNVFNSEGVQYKEPHLKVMGLEIARSSTPTIVRERMKDLIKILVNQGEKEVQDFISQFRTEFKKLEPEEISFPKGVNVLKAYADSNTIFKKGCPIHVRGALLYNHYLDKLNLNKKYPKVKEGDKIKFIYLELPNPILSDVIGYVNRFPYDLGVYDYIDYEKQFEKTFFNPMNTLVESIGWKAEDVNTLESFFN